MIENKQQTAVEWYDNKIGKLFNQFTVDKITIYEFRTEQLKLKQQAIAMHKEETLKLYNEYEDYLDYEFKNQLGGQSVIKSFEEYYNETFWGSRQIK